MTVAEEDARFYDFDVDARDTRVTGHEHLTVPDPHGHHLRTVSRHTGRDDEADQQRFFDEIADELREEAAGRDVVVLGHGTGESDAAEQFVARVEKKHPPVRSMIKAFGTIDLSAATESDLEKKAEKLAAGV